MKTSYYHAPTNSIIRLPKTHGRTTDFPHAGEKAHRAAGYFPVKETVYSEGDAASVSYDEATGVATVTRVVVPEPEPFVPSEHVIAAAIELQATATKINQEYPGLELQITDGYATLKAKVFASDSPVPSGLRGDVVTELTLAYNQLQYHWGRETGGAEAWDMFPIIAEHLTALQ